MAENECAGCRYEALILEYVQDRYIKLKNTAARAHLNGDTVDGAFYTQLFLDLIVAYRKRNGLSFEIYHFRIKD